MDRVNAFIHCFVTIAFNIVLHPDKTLPQQSLQELLNRAPQTHPRIFFSANEEVQLREKIEQDSLLRPVYALMLKNAELMLNEPLLKYQKEGRRLLDVSRMALLRMLNWCLAYRLSGEARYADRAEAELLVMCAFSDWNPGHFLDVAEMTTAVGIGYDWLYPCLNPESRCLIREAIVEKGLKPSFEGEPWWVQANNNWNQVCHGGLVVGALAIYEDEPELATRTIQRALDNIHHSMEAYAPDGNYPEGASYWSYGTSYNLMLIDSLQTVLGSDFHLPQAPGFMESAEYFLHVAGPSGLYYNYSDARCVPNLAPEVFWFGARAKDTGLLWREASRMREALRAAENPFAQSRLLPMLFVWSPPLGGIHAPVQCSWRGDGHTPVAMHRSHWNDPDALFLGFKGGSPSANHAHMDIGGFVMEADGVRWACDLERQDYHELEHQGIQIFNKVQRWKIFRINNFSHNVLTVDGQLQELEGFAPITQHRSEGKLPHTIVDLSEIYAGQLAQARRGAGIHADGYVLIRDELQALDKVTSVRWGMVTFADVCIESGGQASLRQDGKVLILQLDSSVEAELEVCDIERPPNDFEASNPGAKMIAFTVKLAPHAKVDFTVSLIPGKASEPKSSLGALADWSSL